MITNSILNEYGFHDTEINKIEFMENSIVLYFVKGIYILDSGKETLKTNQCVMKLGVNNSDEIFQNIEITAIRRKKIKEIDLNELINMVRSDVFNVNNLFMSNFNQTILICGFSGKNEIYITISCIKECSIDVMK